MNASMHPCIYIYMYHSLRDKNIVFCRIGPTPLGVGGIVPKHNIFIPLGRHGHE